MSEMAPPGSVMRDTDAHVVDVRERRAICETIDRSSTRQMQTCCERRCFWPILAVKEGAQRSRWRSDMR